MKSRAADWTHEGQARDYDISKSQFRAYAIGQLVAFEEHRGALGFRWLGNLRAAPAKRSTQLSPRISAHGLSG